MSNKRVVLVRPSYSGVYQLFKDKTKTAIVPPIGLAYMGAALRRGTYQGDSVRSGVTIGFDPVIIDNEVEKLPSDRLAERILQENPILVGISAATTSFYEANKTAEEIKKRSGIPICLGGPHASSVGKDCLEEGQYFDFAIPGEGEFACLELAEAIYAGEDPRQIAGLVHRIDGSVQANDPRPFIEDLNDLPQQAFDLLPMSEYHHLIPGRGMNPMGAILSSRGCPQRCGFCQSMYGTRIRTRSSEKVLSEIEHLVGEYGVQWLTFYDDTFTWPEKIPEGEDPRTFDRFGRIKKICKGMVERGLALPHQVFMRANLVDERALEEIVRAGCKVVSIGIESGDDEILKRIRKGTNQEIIEEALARLYKFYPDIEIRGSFILGLPGETHTSVQRTMDSIRRSPIQRANINIATPYPGTALYEMAIRGDGIRFLPGVERDWDKFRRHGNCLIEVGDLSPDALLAYQETGHTILYTRPDVLAHHFDQLEQCLRNGSSLRENAYHFRPFMYALKKLHDIKAGENQLADSEGPIFLSTLRRWRDLLTEPIHSLEAGGRREVRRAISSLNRAFGFEKQDITPKGESTFAVEKKDT